MASRLGLDLRGKVDQCKVKGERTCVVCVQIFVQGEMTPTGGLEGKGGKGAALARDDLL